MLPSQQLSPEGRLVVDEFVRLRTSDPASFNTAISPEDEMYLFLLNESKTVDHDRSHLRYFESGKLMLEEYRPIVEATFGGYDKVDSILEFACGHGRFTRFLVQEAPPGSVFVSDIYSDAVAFQTGQFGVAGKLSVEDPDDYRDDRRYQLILVSSLFSHLPPDTFGRWLGRLYDLLTEDGVLVFSVHDEAVIPVHLPMNRSGITFVGSSESRSLATSQYGTTFVSEKYVSDVIAKACPDAGGYVRIQKGLWRYQDLYVVARSGMRDTSEAGRNRGPQGYLERCRLQEPLHYYSLEGWAFDFDEGAVVEEVEVQVGGERVQACLPSHPRPDVAAHFENSRAAHSGWACLLRPEQVRPDQIVSIVLRSSSGRSSVITFETLERLCSEAAAGV